MLIEVPLEDPGVRVHCNLQEDDLCKTNSTVKLDVFAPTAALTRNLLVTSNRWQFIASSYIQLTYENPYFFKFIQNPNFINF